MLSSGCTGAGSCRSRSECDLGHLGAMSTRAPLWWLSLVRFVHNQPSNDPFFPICLAALGKLPNDIAAPVSDKKPDLILFLKGNNRLENF